jgi:acyl-coenzyme A synthetase/AMP-(fatty) acid ligase
VQGKGGGGASHPQRALIHSLGAPKSASQRPDQRSNELVLFVEADASVTRDDLFAWGRRLLAPYMVPREIEVTTALPRTATGKADRQALLRLVSA